MKTLVIFSTLLAIALSYEERENVLFPPTWRQFKTKYGKVYKSTAEELIRRSNYINNVRKINDQNARIIVGKTTFTAKVTRFADMSHKQFLKYIGADRDMAQLRYDNNLTSFSIQELCSMPQTRDACSITPDSVDWRQDGAVTSVKDQGACPASWAFAAVGAVESQIYRSSGELVELSEQQLVDCSSNGGCKGSSMISAYDYIIKNGITQSKSYPYVADNKTCRYTPNNQATKIKSYVKIPQFSEDDLRIAVANIGPVAVAIDASQFFFKFYGDGIYREKLCNSTKLNHAVLVVGYGTEEEQDYWIIKNSWGTDWANDGYMKIARNKNNACGIATLGSVPLLY